MRYMLLALIFFFPEITTAQTLPYPKTERRPVHDTLFGKVVTDDYRWLEAMNEPEVRSWLKAQAALTDSILAKIPVRDKLIEEYKALDTMVKTSVPYGARKGGDRYFYMRSFAGQPVLQLYYKNGRKGREIPLWDPTTFSGGEYKYVSYRFFPSRDGKKVALRITRKGNSDIATLRILDVASRQFLPDSIYPVDGVHAWTPDSRGLLYGAYQTDDPTSTLLFHDVEIKYHQIGQRQEQDKSILSRKHDPRLELKSADLLSVGYSHDDKYLMATIWSGLQDNNRSFFAPAVETGNAEIDWKPLARAEDEIREAIIYRGNVYLLTRKDAPNFKILVSPVAPFDIRNARTLVPETDKPIQRWSINRDFLFIQKSAGINIEVDQFDLRNGKVTTIKLPYSGNVWVATYGAETNECDIEISSWHLPPKRFSYDPFSHKFSNSEFNDPLNYPGVDELVVEELEVKSHDGVMVPLSLVYNKKLKKDGTNTVFMTGYGSYGAYFTPFFDLMYLPLLNRGVVVAITHPRGGGEKGHAWHMGGFKATKPNTWKDFIACGEYLIQQGYTSPKHLIGDGTSAGGIMIGRAITERPDLFAAAINNVPVSNPLRGENRPNGQLDANEFGTIKDSTEAMGLIKMDAYLHVSDEVQYPAVLAVTGINDTRVPFWQPAKFVAALQRSASKRPVLLLVNYDSGHWSEDKQVRYREFANRFAFALWQAGKGGRCD